MRTSGHQRPRDPIIGATLAIASLALGLRLYHLTAQSLSYDEAVSVLLARMSWPDMLRWTATDVQPPLYYALLRFWTGLAGQSEYALRLLSVFASVAAVAGFYRLAAEVGGKRTGMLAAAVAAVHPWYVWQAQDTRMYSLLILLGVLSSYLFRRWLGAAEGGQRRASVPLVFCYAAILYTHYLGAALLAYHFLVLAATGRGQVVRRYLIRVGLPTVVAYLPWLPAVLSTYRADTSYYQGPLKLTEVARKGFISLFVGAPGETVLEPTGLRLYLLMGGVLLILLVGLLAAKRSRNPWFSLGLVLVPALLTGLLLLIVPKFNPRYLILASIGIPLLWGQGLAAMSLRRASGAAIALVAGACLVSGSAIGLQGMFADPRFTRADFRSAIGTILSQRQPAEPVILSSGHIYPVMEYYAPGVSYVPFPPSRVLAVGEVLDFSVVPELAQALAGADGAWLLLWQDEVTDPMGVLPYILGQAGDAEEFSFWHVRLRHYRFPAAPDLSHMPRIGDPSQCAFEGGIRLLGMTQGDEDELSVFWQANTVPEQDLRAQLELRDGAGHLVARQHFAPAGDDYPSHLWRPGQVVFASVPLAPDPGVPPGSYQAAITLYRAATGEPLTLLDPAGNPAGQVCPLGKVQLGGATEGLDPVAAARELGLSPRQDRWESLGLVGIGACPEAPLVPGQSLTIPLLWQTTGELPAVELGVGLRYADGTGSTAQVPLSSAYPTQEWKPGSVVRTWLDFRVPADAPAGEAELIVEALAAASSLGPPASICQVTVTNIARQYDLPSPDWPSEAVFGGFARLVGLDVEPASVAPGESLTVQIHWQATETPDRNYEVFVHLIGPDGRVWAQFDGEPAGRPTAGWVPGEVLSFSHRLDLPGGAPSGEYHLEVGMVDTHWGTAIRLAAISQGSRLPADAAILGTIQVR